MTVELPADRAAVREIAARAEAALAAAVAALSDEERGWLAAAPLEWTASEYGKYAPDWTYERQPRSIARLEARTRELGGDLWTGRYARLVLYELLARLPVRVPRLSIPDAQWESVECSLREVFESVAGHAAVAWSDDAFVKDVAVAQLRVIPTGFSFMDPHRSTARWLASSARRRERLALLSYLGPDYFRAVDVVSNHAWRGFRAGVREPREARYLVMAEILEANPYVRYLVRTGWLIDPKLTKITPHLTEQFEGMVAIGGHRYRGKTSPEVTAMALQSSTTRRKLYDEGKYQPMEYGLIIKRGDLLDWADGWRRAQLSAPVDAANPGR